MIQGTVKLLLFYFAGLIKSSFTSLVVFLCTLATWEPSPADYFYSSERGLRGHRGNDGVLVLWSLWGMWSVWTIIWKISVTWLNPRRSTVNDVLHGPLQHGSEIIFTRTSWAARGNVKGLDRVWLKSGAIPNMLLWINVLVVWILNW